MLSDLFCYFAYWLKFLRFQLNGSLLFYPVTILNIGRQLLDILICTYLLIQKILLGFYSVLGNIQGISLSQLYNWQQSLMRRIRVDQDLPSSTFFRLLGFLTPAYCSQSYPEEELRQHVDVLCLFHPHLKLRWK